MYSWQMYSWHKMKSSLSYRRSLWKRIAGGGLLCSALFLGTASLAAEGDKGALFLVTGGDYAPYTSDAMESGGVVTEIVQRVLARAGYESSIRFYPWNRAYKRTLNVESDATFPYAKTEERSRDFLFSYVINSPQISLLHQRGQSGKVEQWSDLSGKILCQPLGYSLLSGVKDLIEQGLLERNEANTIDQCVHSLLRGNVDVVIADNLVLHEALWRVTGKVKVDEVVIEPSPLVGTGEHFIVSRQHPKAATLIADFNKAYEEMLKAGEIKEIWTKHIGPFITIPPLRLEDAP